MSYRSKNNKGRGRRSEAMNKRPSEAEVKYDKQMASLSLYTGAAQLYSLD